MGPTIKIIIIVCLVILLIYFTIVRVFEYTALLGTIAFAGSFARESHQLGKSTNLLPVGISPTHVSPTNIPPTNIPTTNIPTTSISPTSNAITH